MPNFDLSIVSILLIATLAGARSYRLVAIDTAGEPARRVIRMLIFRLMRRGQDKKADLIEEGAECPFCIGYWMTSLWVLTGLLWGTTLVWLLLAGSFAANYVGGQLNAWLDAKPIKDGGGEIDIMEDKVDGEA